MAIDKNTKDLIIYAGVAGVIYFFVAKPLLEKFGVIKSAEQVKQEDVTNKGRETFINDSLKVQKPTKPEGQFAILADQLYEYLKYSAISDEKSKAWELLYVNLNNDADAALLLKYFGKRQEYNLGFPVGGLKNLSEFVTTNLNKQYIDNLNQRYLKSKMKFRF